MRFDYGIYFIMGFSEVEKALTETLPILLSEMKAMKAEIRQLKHGDRLSYNLKELGKLTGHSYSYWHSRFENGTLKACQEGAGGKIVVRREVVEQLLAEMEEKTNL